LTFDIIVLPLIFFEQRGFCFSGSGACAHGFTFKQPASGKGAKMNLLSKTANRDLMAQARESLRGRWGLAIGTFLVAQIIVTGVSMIPAVGSIGGLIIDGPISVGMAIFALALSRNQNPQFSQIFEGFQKFGVALGAYLLMILFVFLWLLLLIIPGIIAAYAYSQIFYIIVEDANIGPLQAIRKSKEMMRGNKWKLFCLNLRFIGWALLCVLTFGIGFLWLCPYMIISFAKFYDDLAHPAAGPQTEPAAVEPASA
jgi:uncharacterized membrane protein